ncbi:MAG TPA: GYD domain-containing protein [Thermoplasmata archaeon]|jgi:uncharacterized protein with GYD domain|nr:GYD domain-containing protein [Thermoplasmata archaeon]
MPTYILLGRLTALAKTHPAESLKARDQIFAEFQKKGLKITYFMTLGPYDVVNIVEAPSEELMIQFLVAAGAQGYVDSVTLRAFSPQEADRLRTG